MSYRRLNNPVRPPFDIIPAADAKRLSGYPGIILLGVLTLTLGDPMRTHSDALIGPMTPLGILTLQLTWNPATTHAILSAWNNVALQHAYLSLYWDMGFAPAYGLLLAALTHRLLAPRTKPRQPLHAGIAWLPLWATLSDWLENLFHLNLLSAHDFGANGPWATLACAAALIKWSLLASWLIGFVWLALRRKIAG